MIRALVEDMQELANMPFVKAVFAAGWCVVLKLAGHPESAAVWLLGLMACDFALGFCRAWDCGDIRGAKLRSGAFKFLQYWVAVAVFSMVDPPVAKAFPVLPVSLRDCFIAYLSVNEALSCVEHLAYFGVPIPEGLLARLRSYRDASVAGGIDRTGRGQGEEE